MRFLKSKKFLVVAASVVVAGAVAAVAIPAVTSQTIINDSNSVHFRVVRTAANGFDSGWHVHPGVAIVQVQEGSFQIYQDSCTPRTVSAGETYIEIPHDPVRAIATGPVAWTTTLLTNGGDLPQIPLSSYSSGVNPCPSLP
jgi:hypothetical protein